MKHRAIGILFVLAAAGFAITSSVLSSTFDWPDILRRPPAVILQSVLDHGTGLTWTWFAVAWSYALLGVPLLLLPSLLGRSTRVRVATAVGGVSILLCLIGFLRWVFVVPQLAGQWAAADGAGRVGIEAAFTAQHQFGGALLGEHLGQLLAIGWSVLISLELLRGQKWLAIGGLAASALYLANQGDILSTAVPGFWVWELGGLLGSLLWGAWILALGARLLFLPPAGVARDELALAA